jgi:hypothetical protein
MTGLRPVAIHQHPGGIGDAEPHDARYREPEADAVGAEPEPVLREDGDQGEERARPGHGGHEVGEAHQHEAGPAREEVELRAERAGRRLRASRARRPQIARLRHAEEARAAARMPATA